MVSTHSSVPRVHTRLGEKLATSSLARGFIPLKAGRLLLEELLRPWTKSNPSLLNIRR